jgi:hypothetical protein
MGQRGFWGKEQRIQKLHDKKPVLVLLSAQIEELFELFDQHLRAQGYEARGGRIIDATLVPVP